MKNLGKQLYDSYILDFLMLLATLLFALIFTPIFLAFKLAERIGREQCTGGIIYTASSMSLEVFLGR